MLKILKRETRLERRMISFTQCNTSKEITIQAILFPQSIDEIVDHDNEVRIINFFEKSIDLAHSDSL